MNFIGNLLWIIFGGILIAIEYVLAGIALCLTIVGIPFGIQAFKLAGLALFPFGKTTVQRRNASDTLSLIMNIIWILIGGIWISLSHIILGLILFITIIGIPFATQHFKLAGLAFTPFGREIVNT